MSWLASPDISVNPDILVNHNISAGSDIPLWHSHQSQVGTPNISILIIASVPILPETGTPSLGDMIFSLVLTFAINRDMSTSPNIRVNSDITGSPDLFCNTHTLGYGIQVTNVYFHLRQLLILCGCERAVKISTSALHYR